MNQLPTKPDLPYRHEFEKHELEAIDECTNTHGFAIVKNAIDDEVVESLRSAVKHVLISENDLPPKASRTAHAFVEKTDVLFRLLRNVEFMKICRMLTRADDLTINRSAAIVRNIGSDPVRWHTDWSSAEKPERLGQALNCGEWPSGLWFYLNGSCPERGGLCIMEDSHVPGWTWPEGYTLNSDSPTFSVEGQNDPIDFHEVPGCIPLFTEPNDLIVFAARTYHAAFSNLGPDIRLSCGFNFRPRGPVCIDWEPPVEAKQFIENAPDDVQPFLHHYTGFDA